MVHLSVSRQPISFMRKLTANAPLRGGLWKSRAPIAVSRLPYHVARTWHMVVYATHSDRSSLQLAAKRRARIQIQMRCPDAVVWHHPSITLLHISTGLNFCGTPLRRALLGQIGAATKLVHTTWARNSTPTRLSKSLGSSLGGPEHRRRDYAAAIGTVSAGTAGAASRICGSDALSSSTCVPSGPMNTAP